MNQVSLRQLIVPPTLFKTICCVITVAAGSLPLRAGEPLRLIAHRGGVVDEQTIENNVRSIQEAIRRGYGMVEVDIRRSRDGVPVVQHDATFQRYYGDSRAVADMNWEEIAQLRATPGGERPLTFAEYVDACDGKLRFMLDIKGEDHPAEYLASIEKTLQERDLLESAYVMGATPTKDYFRDKARITGNADVIFAAAENGEPVAERYVLFDRGSRITEPVVKRAVSLNVPVVAAINRFRYPDDEETAAAQSKADIARLKSLGVSQFQIDSMYDVWLRDVK